MADERKKIVELAIAAGLIVVLAVTVIVGIATLTAFSEATRGDTTVNRENHTDVSALLANQSVRVGTPGAYPFLKSLTGCKNVSNATSYLLTTYYDITKGDADGGYITLNNAGYNAGWNNTGINCSSLRYSPDSDAQAAADAFIVGIIIFGSFVGVLIIGMIGKSLLAMFRKNQ